MWRDKVDVLTRGAGDIVVQIPQYVLALTVGILENGGGCKAILQNLRRLTEQVGGDDGQVLLVVAADAIAGNDRAGRCYIDAAERGIVTQKLLCDLGNTGRFF